MGDPQVIQYCITNHFNKPSNFGVPCFEKPPVDKLTCHEWALHHSVPSHHQAPKKCSLAHDWRQTWVIWLSPSTLTSYLWGPTASSPDPNLYINASELLPEPLVDGFRSLDCLLLYSYQTWKWQTTIPVNQIAETRKTTHKAIGHCSFACNVHLRFEAEQIWKLNSNFTINKAAVTVFSWDFGLKHRLLPYELSLSIHFWIIQPHTNYYYQMIFQFMYEELNPRTIQNLKRQFAKWTARLWNY